MGSCDITMTDSDGNVYKTVKIGDQVWIAENLKTTRYKDASMIPLITNNYEWSRLRTPAYCYYDNDVDNKDKYGALYNWYTVDIRKLSPDGWHIPTREDWDTLESYLIANAYNYDGSKKYNKIAKSLASNTDWKENTDYEGIIGNRLFNTLENRKNNRTGFSALPGGLRGEDGGFYRLGTGGRWWIAADENYSGSVEYCCLDNSGINLFRLSGPKSNGCSIRLVRD